MTVNDEYVLYVENFLLEMKKNSECIEYVITNSYLANSIKNVTEQILEKIKVRRENNIINTNKDCENISNNIENYYRYTSQFFQTYKTFLGEKRKNKIKKMLQ